MAYRQIDNLIIEISLVGKTNITEMENVHSAYL